MGKEGLFLSLAVGAVLLEWQASKFVDLKYHVLPV